MVNHEIRQLLERRKKELLDLMDRLQKESDAETFSGPFSGEIEDTVETATTLTEKEFVNTHIINVADQLFMVRHALHKMEQYPDRFGKCELCMRPIEKDRLEIKPWARYCKDCKESIERRTRRT